MAERPIDVVRLALAAFEAKDLDAAFALAHQDAVFHWRTSSTPGRRVRMRVRDDLETEARGAQLWTVRDGKVAEAKLFQSLADAQAAVAGA